MATNADSVYVTDGGNVTQSVQYNEESPVHENKTDGEYTRDQTLTRKKQRPDRSVTFPSDYVVTAVHFPSAYAYDPQERTTASTQVLSRLSSTASDTATDETTRDKNAEAEAAEAAEAEARYRRVTSNRPLDPNSYAARRMMGIVYGR